MLVVDLFGSTLQNLPSGTDTGNTVRHAYQAARDTFYLFRARHLLAYGNDLLASIRQPARFGGRQPTGRTRRLRAGQGEIEFGEDGAAGRSGWRCIQRHRHRNA